MSGDNPMVTISLSGDGGEERAAAGHNAVHSVDYEEESQIPLPLPEKSKWEQYWDTITGPWNRLSKRQKTFIIVSLTAVILVVLVVAIFVPYFWQTKVNRYYYIQAEVIEDWDYAPDRYNVVYDRPWNDYEKLYVERTNSTIGTVYKKAVFVGYTDETFTERSKQPAYMGLVGPTLHGVVGEHIEVTLKNELPFAISLYFSGLELSKRSEGVPYHDGSIHKNGSRIEPGEEYTYVLELSELDGPATGDFSTVAYPYYSKVDEVADFATGLSGIFVVSSEGSSNEEGLANDVDQELVLLAAVFDENKSYFFNENFERTMSEYNMNDTQKEALQKNPEFIESNRMYTLNGFVYGNWDGLQIEVGSRTRWYVMGLGEGIHTIDWSGMTTVSQSMRSGSLVAFPGTADVADIQPLYTGTWLLSSYGSDAINGMETLFSVEEEFAEEEHEEEGGEEEH